MQQETVKESREATTRTLPVASHSRMVLALIIIAGFLDVIDFSIVQVALPTIRTELTVSLAESQWIVGAYGLTMAGFLMLSGRAGDVYGQKKLFVFGIILFSTASLTGGLAPSLLPLIISRGVQGVGAAISSVTAFAILIATFPEGRERNRALGIFVAVLSAGFAAGSIAGGFLTATFGWRSVMFVNVPIGAVGAVLSQKFLPVSGGRAVERRLDLPGALTITSGFDTSGVRVDKCRQRGLLVPSNPSGFRRIHPSSCRLPRNRIPVQSSSGTVELPPAGQCPGCEQHRSNIHRFRRRARIPTHSLPPADSRLLGP